MSTKGERLKHANAVILSISKYGRRFFWSEEKQRTARLDFHPMGHIYFVDEYSGRRIYTHHKGHWRGFSGGGTLKQIIIELRKYIQTGDPVDGRFFGPWNPEIIPDGDRWGYGRDAMKDLRAELASNPAVKLYETAGGAS